MAISCVNCTPSFPTLSASCGRTIEKAGINSIAFVLCSNTTILANPDDLLVWQAAVTSGDAVVIKNVIGGLPAPNDITKRLGACEPESLTGRVWTMSFEDYDFTKSGSPFTPEKLNFYNQIMADPSQYFMFYGECQGLMYQVDTFTFYANPNTPTDNTQNKFFECKAMYQQIAMPTPIQFDLNLV